jgi:three-Cys-motif partner protein
VTTPRQTVWDRDGHTGAKHDLLRRYLQAWIPILLAHNRRVTYAEGFAGPGVYTKGEPGSPVIALQTFCQYPDLLDMPSREAHLVFVEELPKRVACLEAELAKAVTELAPLPSALRVRPVVTGDCADVLAEALNDCQAGGSPMFVFLDSFGGPDIPFELLRLVAENHSSEVMLTFQPQFLTRRRSVRRDTLERRVRTRAAPEAPLPRGGVPRNVPPRRL